MIIRILGIVLILGTIAYYALVWLIPQLFIRKIMAKKYERRKIEIQKNKIQKLYPTNTPK